MLQRITASPFIRHVSTLASGAVIGQIVLLSATPIVTRLYAPETFGQFGLIMAISGIFAYVVRLRLDLGVVAADNDDTGLILMVCGILSSFVLSAVIAIGTYYFIRNDWANMGTLPPWTPIAVYPIVAFAGIWMQIRGWCIRQMSYGALAKAQVIQNLVRASGQIGLGLSGTALVGFVVSEIVAMTTIIALQFSKWSERFTAAIMRFTWSEAGRAVHKYRRIPLFGVPSAFIDNLGGVLPLPLVTALFGIEVAGYYALAERILHVPLSFISRSMGDAFLGHMAERLRTNRASARTLLFRTFSSLLLIGLTPALILFFYGEPIFSFAFGANWGMSGRITALMAPLALVWVSVVPVSPTLGASNRLDLKIVFDVTRIVTLLGVFAAAWAWHMQPIEFFVYYTLQGILAYGVYLVLIIIAVHRPHV